MFQRLISAGKKTYGIFSTKNGPSRGAAIAFYTVTSIAPILLIVIAVAGLAFGEEAARGALFQQFRGLMGAQGAEFLQKAIASASGKSAGIVASVISVITLLATASGVFLELQDALNSIWEVKQEAGLARMARARLTSLGLVIALGFLLMVSLVVDAALKGLSGVLDAYLPFGSVLLIIISLLALPRWLKFRSAEVKQTKARELAGLSLSATSGPRKGLLSYRQPTLPVVPVSA